MVATRRKDDQADATGQPDQGTPVSSQGSDPNAVDGLLRSGRAAEPVGRAPTRSRIAHWHGGRAGRSVKYRRERQAGRTTCSEEQSRSVGGSRVSPVASPAISAHDVREFVQPVSNQGSPCPATGPMT